MTPGDQVSTASGTAPSRTQQCLTIITPTYHPEPIGTPLYVTDLSQWFETNGWDVHVVTGQPYYPSLRRHPDYGRATRTDALGAIRITRLPTIVPSGGRRSLRAISDLNFLVQGLIRADRIRETDAVLSVSPGTPWTVLIGSAAARAGARHVALVHDIQSGLASADGVAQALLHRAMRINERWSLNHAERVAALTSDMTDVLTEMGVKRPTHVLPLWSTVQPPCEFPPLEAEVQYSGNFGQKQGVERFNQLVGGLTARGIPVRLRGDGPRFDALVEGLQHLAGHLLRVEGLVPADQLSPALARSPIHLVLQAPGTSRYVMPSKVVNALACGATVIALTDPGSAVEHLSTEVEGLYVVRTNELNGIGTNELETAACMAAELMDRARDPARRHQIARHASHHFSKDAVLTRLKNMLCVEVGR